jgi:hypothetical protein
MDASRLTLTFAVLLLGAGLGRFILSSMGRAGDAMATLFVPPDQALGWPHGVQEGDEPWGWRRPPSVASERPIEPNDDDGGGPADPREWTDPAAGRFVVPVDRVAPVHLGVRPH